MFRIVAGVLLALLATAAAALALAPAQRLAIDLSATTPQVQRQAAYTTAQAIRLHVWAPQASAASLIGVGPNGSNLRLPLARDANGSFAGELRLPAAGMWSLAVVTAFGEDVSTTQSFAVDVADGATLFGRASLLLILAAGSIAGGIGLLALARRRAVPLA
jgi:hypothetical protein